MDLDGWRHLREDLLELDHVVAQGLVDLTFGSFLDGSPVEL